MSHYLIFLDPTVCGLAAGLVNNSKGTGKQEIKTEKKCEILRLANK